MKKIVLSVLFVLAIFTCASSLCHAAGYNVTGTWEGNVKINLETVFLTTTLEQNENLVTGTWQASNGGHGVVTCNLKKKNLRKLVVTLTMEGCYGGYSGGGKLSHRGTAMKIKLSGYDCGGYKKISGTLRKQ
ncbi:MAG TPA: hypothetical protein VJ440_01525 [Candidatus Brocadiaceae bacterium]|nr:hypothetical protein [Candidatus Brocadiaceae bacterium]